MLHFFYSFEQHIKSFCVLSRLPDERVSVRIEGERLYDRVIGGFFSPEWMPHISCPAS
jgi:hypothetical protein